MDRLQLSRDLIQAEGDRRVAYDDRTGLALKPGHSLIGTPTICVGRNLLVPFSDEASTFLLDESIDAVVNQLTAAVPWWASLDVVRQNVLAEMAFQLGTANLLRFSETLRAVNRGHWDEAATELLKSHVAQQCRGRWLRHAARMRSGQFAV